jgi:hypothetical protein
MLGNTIGPNHPSGEIVRTEPRDVAPVIPLPVRMHGNRVIQPLDVPPGTLLPDRERGDGDDVTGRLARALLALDEPGVR